MPKLLNPDVSHVVTLRADEWEIVQEALALYVAVSGWNYQGREVVDIEDTSYHISLELAQ